MPARKDKPVFIYGLCEPGTTNVRYIGRTIRPLKVRLSDHMTRWHLRPKTHKNHWLRGLKERGQRPAIILLDVGTSDTWASLERFHIAAHTAAGFHLTNGNDGGAGSNTHRKYSTQLVWALDYDACLQCSTTEIKHAAHGLCETCYSRKENQHLWQRQRTWDDHLWSVAHPELEQCTACGRNDQPHAGNGLCVRCYAAESREKKRADPWSHPTFDCCQVCGTTEHAHCSRGLCRPCYMTAWYQRQKAIGLR